VPLPAPSQAVSFAAHVEPPFRQRDRQSMSFAIDLWPHDDVRVWGADILQRRWDGSMPCDGVACGEDQGLPALDRQRCGR